MNSTARGTSSTRYSKTPPCPSYRDERFRLLTRSRLTIELATRKSQLPRGRARCRARSLSSFVGSPEDGSRPMSAVTERWVLSERRRRFPQVRQDDEGGLRKAPDNRHEEGDERALRRRPSESRWPRV